MDLPETYISFRELNKFHKFADNLFIEHQIHLMNKQYDTALKQLQYLNNLYAVHLKDEEELLLPLYKDLISPIPQGGAIDFYQREHRQIMQYLDQFEKQLHNWSESGLKNELDLVRLFDTYFKFKHLVEHHDTREDTFLYRLLDRVVDEDNRNSILRKMRLNTSRIKAV